MKLFNSLLGVFGMRHPLGLHDLDLLHEPSAIETPAIASADASTPLQPASAGVDGPPVQSGEASTGGHPNDNEVVAALRDAFRGDLDHLRQVLTDAEIEARWLLSNVQAAVSLLDEMDPTPAGLAPPEGVTDINSRRR